MTQVSVGDFRTGKLDLHDSRTEHGKHMEDHGSTTDYCKNKQLTNPVHPFMNPPISARHNIPKRGFRSHLCRQRLFHKLHSVEAGRTLVARVITYSPALRPKKTDGLDTAWAGTSPRLSMGLQENILYHTYLDS